MTRRSEALMFALATIGLLVGGYLGLMTDRFLPGLFTIGGCVAGAGVGIYIAQAFLSPEDD